MAYFKNLKNLVAVVTGGASGLGQATVKHLIKQGCKVVLCDLPTSNGENVAKDFGTDCVFSSTDVTSEDEVKNMFYMIKERFKKLDITVNCAGIARAYQIYNFNTNVAHDLEDFATPINVNVVGSFNVLRLAAGIMGKNTPDENGQRGLIINTSSVCAFDGEIGQSAYSASSSALVSMTLPIARDLSTQGIRCCTIAAGLFRTPLLNVPEKYISFLSDMVCFPNRVGLPEEFAHLIQYIIENPMINGEVIRLDGGLRLTL